MIRETIVFLAALAAGQTLPNHGPYADKPGWVCYRGETVERAKRVQCGCHLRCAQDGTPVEDPTCQTYCVAKEKCLCHTDEACEPH